MAPNCNRLSLALWKTKKQKKNLEKNQIQLTTNQSEKTPNCWNVQEEGEQEEGEFSIVGFEKLVRNESPGECGVPQPMAPRLCK